MRLRPLPGRNAARSAATVDTSRGPRATLRRLDWGPVRATPPDASSLTGPACRRTQKSKGCTPGITRPSRQADLLQRGLQDERSAEDLDSRRLDPHGCLAAERRCHSPDAGGAIGRTRFHAPFGLRAGPYVSISAPATSGMCYPPFQGVWILVGGDACPTPALTATAHLDPGRREVMATIIARGLGAEDRCGRAELSVDHQRIGALRQTGSTATGTVRLTGSRKLHQHAARQGDAARHDRHARRAGPRGKPTFQTATAVRTSTEP